MKFLMIWVLLMSFLSAESRVALLIGNSDYQYIDTLKDPSTNINRLKKSLEDLDFTVTVEKNLNSEYLSESIEQFANRLAQDKNNIGFLYYSGHGCQLNHQGYLIPTNVDTKNRVKIKHHALRINEMLDTLSMANNRVNMLFLDACRDVPTGTRGGTKGLGQPTATPKGSLVVYATEAGKTAEDNSNFINALIENIKQPNEDIKDIADNISNAVADKTEEKQIPVVFYKRLPEVILQKSDIVFKPDPIIILESKIDSFQAKPLSSEQQKIKKKFDNVTNAYQNNIVNFNQFFPDKFKDNLICQKNNHFQQVSKGLAILTSYYYLFRYELFESNYKKIIYPHTTEEDYKFIYPAYEDIYWNVKKGMSFSEIINGADYSKTIKYFSKNYSKIKKADKKYIYAFLKELQSYYIKFIEYKNDKNMDYLKKNKTSNLYIGLGFKKNKDICFQDKETVRLKNIYIKNIKDKGTYINLMYGLDNYFYGFWFRRYTEDTIDITKKTLDFVISALE